MSPAGAGFSHPRNVLTMLVSASPPPSPPTSKPQGHLLRRTKDLCPAAGCDLDIYGCPGREMSALDKLLPIEAPSKLGKAGVHLGLTWVQIGGKQSCGSSEDDGGQGRGR